MSEFIEIDDYVLRVSDIKYATAVKKGVIVCFTDGKTGRFDEPYESVRDKLLGKPQTIRIKGDLRGEFVEQLAAVLRKRNQPVAAILVEEFYHSLMLSETEGAG